MCEDPRFKVAYVICSVCVVNDCKNKDVKSIQGCEFGKPSNEALLWAFEYTNTLREAGLTRKKCTNFEEVKKP